jgi:hypothetical protein
MATRKVKRKSKHYRSSKKAGKTLEDGKESLNKFNNLLAKLDGRVFAKWQSANSQEKERMIFSFITSSENKEEDYRRKYFEDGKPNFEKFSKDIFGKDKKKNYHNIIKGGTGILERSYRNFLFAQNGIEDFRNTEEFKQMPKTQKKYVERRIAGSRAQIMTPRVEKIQRKNVNELYLKKGFSSSQKKILDKAFENFKSGSKAEKLEKAREDPQRWAQVLGSIMAYDRGVTEKQAKEIYKKTTGLKGEQLLKELKLYHQDRDEPVDKVARKISSNLGYSSPGQYKNQTLTLALEKYIRDHPSFSGLTVDEKLERLKGTEIKYEDLVKANDGKKVSLNAMKTKAKKLGVKIVGGPRGKSSSGKGKSGRKSGSYSSGRYTSGGTNYKPTPLFGGKDFSLSDKGELKSKKRKGRIGKAYDKFKKKTWGKVHPKPGKRAKEFEKKYDEYLPAEYTNEAKKVMEKTSGPTGWLKRRFKEREAKKMAIDDNYRAKVQEKRMLDKGIQTAKLIRAKKEAQAMSRAATSPWYRAFYRFSKYSKWIALTALIISIVFIPMGMFYVLGWALAVAVVALFQFIVWVFMEIWFLLAQFVVAIVSLIGQMVVMLINKVGQALGGIVGVKGQDYELFEYQTVQNMLMFEKNAAGDWVVLTYNDVGEKQQLFTWGQLNLTPPNFLNLDLYKPTEFDTDTIIAKLIPPLTNFFHWMYNPIAKRYTMWMTDPATPWYWPGIIIGVPAVIVIVSIVLIWRYLKVKYQTI